MVRHLQRDITLFTSTLPSGIDWHDARTLEPLDGPLARYPLARVVLLAHRTKASGLLRVFDGETSHGFGLRDGKVVSVTGVEALLRDLLPDDQGELELEAAVGKAMAGGHALEAVLDEAGKSVGRALAGWCLTDIGILSFKPDPSPSNKGFPLPKSLIALLSHGLYSLGSPAQGQKLLQAQPGDPIAVLLPSGTGEDRPGLDALSLRVLNLARARPPFQDLVARATRGNSARRREVLHRVYLLHRMGLLHLPEPALQTDEETQRVPRRRQRKRRTPSRSPELSRTPERRPGGERRSSKPEGPTPEQQVAKLRKRTEMLRAQNFYQRLGLGEAESKPTPKDCDEAFHKLSRRYHPDAQGDSTTEVRDAAEDVFALLSEAIEGLRKKRVAEEQWERTRCAQQGRPYVTDRDRTKAKMSFKKGERLFRNRDYAIAEACFHEAKTKDPETPTYAFWHAYSAYLAKQMPADEALKILTALKPETQQQSSEFHFTIGRILRLSGGDETKAIEHFEKAVAANPDNRDAQRELRLVAMRTDTKAKASGTTFGSFLDRFRRKSKDD